MSAVIEYAFEPKLPRLIEVDLNELPKLLRLAICRSHAALGSSRCVIPYIIGVFEIISQKTQTRLNNIAKGTYTFHATSDASLDTIIRTGFNGLRSNGIMGSGTYISPFLGFTSRYHQKYERGGWPSVLVPDPTSDDVFISIAALTHQNGIRWSEDETEGLVTHNTDIVPQYIIMYVDSKKTQFEGDLHSITTSYNPK